jgi:hypothetical protein
MKTIGQISGDGLGLTTFNAGGCLQVALRVKGERNKREGGSKNNSGKPVTAQRHKIHEGIRILRELKTVVRIHLCRAVSGDLNLLH